MTYYGDIHLGDTLDFAFVTTSASTGAPTTLSGVPVLSCYVGSSTTELTAGITLTVDFDTRTGYNHVTIVASSGNGYTTATNVNVVITTGTVGGTSAVGYVVGSFSIDKRGVNQILGTAVSTPATAGVLDVNVKNINNAAAATPGASGGLHINGSNSGTTTYAALTVTGSLTISDGLLVSRSTSNASAATFTGNGTGSGAVFTSGAGATGDGVQMTAGSTNGSGLKLTKTGSGSDFNATVTPLVLAKTTNLTGLNDIAAGAAMTLTAAYDAAKTAMASYTQPTGFLAATFPTGTVANTTNITAGTMTTTTNLTNAPTAGDFTATMKTSIGTAVAASAVASVTGNVGGNVTGSVGSVTGNVGGNVVGSVASVSGNVGGNVVGSVGSVTAGVSLAANSVDSTAVATSGAQEIATAVGALSLGASNNNFTLIQGQTVLLSAVAGKVSGEDVGAPAFRDLADTKDVISGTDTGTGNRTAITYNP